MRNFNSAQQKLPSKNDTEITAEILNITRIKMVLNSKKDLYNNAPMNNDYKQNIEFQHNVFAQARKRKSNRGRKTIFNRKYFQHNKVP